MIVSFLVVIYPCIYLLLRKGDFFLANFLISLLFYSSFLFFFVSKAPNFVDLEYFNIRYIPFLKWIIIIQSSIGILQVLLAREGVDLSTGDYVQGTINTFSFINHENGFANVFFVINMTTLVATYYMLALKKNKMVVLLGCSVIVLASTVHLSLALIGALLATYISLNVLKTIKIMFPIMFFFIILYAFFPRNFASLDNYGNQILEAKNLKVKSSIITYNSLINSPKDFVLGYGLGQYSSRGALVSSGNYFYDNQTKKYRTPLGIKNQTDIFVKNLKRNWIASLTDEGYGFSVMNKPIYSLLSIGSELGIVFLLTAIFLFFMFINRIGDRYKKEKDELHKRKNLLILLISFFLLGISFFENYLEMAQAIFCSLILLKILPSSKRKV